MQADPQTLLVVLALVAFNGPIVFAAIQVARVQGLGGQIGVALKEKDAAGDPTDATSYSRVTGAIGAVIVVPCSGSSAT